MKKLGAMNVRGDKKGARNLGPKRFTKGKPQKGEAEKPRGFAVVLDGGC